MSRRLFPTGLFTRITAVISLAFLAAGARAQVVAPLPVFPAIDSNSVDLATGSFNVAQTDVVIGQPDSGGLAYTRYLSSGVNSSWTHSQNGYISISGTTCSVVIGANTETFNSTNGCQSTTSNQQMGSQLTYNSGTQKWTYVKRDGTTAIFSSTVYSNVEFSMYGATGVAYISKLTTPQGVVINYNYEIETVGPFCIPDDINCYQIVSYWYGRLSNVTTNTGYALILHYPSAPSTLVPPDKVTGVNRAIEYCSGSDCTLSWPSATYAYNVNRWLTSVTNAVGAATTYSYSGWRATKVQFPDNASHAIDVTYDGSGRVQTVSPGFGTWTYAYADASGQRTTTVTDPTSKTRVYVSEISSGRILSFTNEYSKTTSHLYDSAKRLTRVTQPEGNYVQYTYDGRGNVTQTQWVPKGGGTAITTSATYPSTCTNVFTCNQPTSTTDALSNVTDYTYDTTHGGITTITAPIAPLGYRPQTRFTYAQKQAYYKTSVSTWTSGTAVYRLTATSACATSSSCAGTGDETVTEFAFAGATTPNNLLPLSRTVRAGNSAVSATTQITYTNWGDVDTVDAPLSGSADTTRYYYDAMRRVTGVVGPDPDGGGSLLYRAARTTYNAVGQPTVIERGTVTSQGASAFSSFSTLDKQETVYDAYARPAQSRRFDGGSIVALTQTSYDSRGQVACTAVRMNTAYFGSAPTSACTQTSGIPVADRITATSYDDAGRVSQVQSGYGTGLVQTTQAYTYSDNGQVVSLTDARSYRTGYEYDGFDRLSKRYYPNPSTTNTSNGSDYEQYTYDAAGRVTAERRRSGDSFAYSYDNLGRVTGRDAPGSDPDLTLGYDLFGRATSVSQTGNTLTTGYDALSRVTSIQSSVLGTVSYQYDAAGRRTQMTYPGSFYVTYTYDTAGDLTGILQSGSTSLAAYEYDNLGRRTKLTRGNGVVTNYTFDAVSRLATLSQDAAGTGYDNTVTLGYNPSSQITSRTRTNGAYDWGLPASFSESYAADGLNRYTSARGATPGYDTRGNLTGDGTTTYGYDYDNRITSASGGVTVGYDPLGRLYQVAGASTTRFLYDGANAIAEYDTSGTVLRRYVHGPGTDEPLVWYEGSGTGSPQYLLADERGSVIGVTNGSGTVTQVNTYDAYGVPGAGNQGRFQYTGQMWIAELGVYHYKARAYHAKLGRFMQTDPIGTAGGMNLYAYVQGDPVGFTDSSGLDPDPTPSYVTVTGSRVRDSAPEPGCMSVYCLIDLGRWVSIDEIIGGVVSPPESPAEVVVTGKRPQSQQPKRQSDACTFDPLSKDDTASVNAMLAEPRIASAMARAWRQTTNTGLEHGFWIYQNGGSYRPGEIHVGSENQMDPDFYLEYIRAQVNKTLLPLSNVHTHPGTYPAAGQPSVGDGWVNDETNTLGIILTHSGIRSGRSCH